MTAFARSERVAEQGTVTWELRSVNHRYLEPVLRLPEAFRALEPVVRERLGQRLGRGKLDCVLKFQSGTTVLTGVSLNRTLAERLVALADELAPLLPRDPGLRVGDLLRWPGVVNEPEPDLAPVLALAREGLDAALDELIATREREGERIRELIRQRCAAMSAELARVRERRPQVLARQREKLEGRLAEIDIEADPTRLEQELVLLAQRLDVEEELDRLEAHLAEIAEVLERTEPVGRRLDFLMQELNREANTLASKSADTETTRAGVELKVLIEQMREQVQNIE
ncbi:MAG: YicC/YloC family endoribonuclease [Candidatus Competibacterales bacterium]|nr:YicC/YloC family endoribonuclease [Candidatus Competibacterales bacterium]